jgi:ABC-type phosphate/phosphonate transport system permease subunit
LRLASTVAIDDVVTNPSPEQSHRLRGLQDHLLRLLGNRVEARAEIVQRMLQRDANEAVSYWLQLCVSVGIATLGLVVGSSAVVIGAMLIAPLMGQSSLLPWGSLRVLHSWSSAPEVGSC